MLSLVSSAFDIAIQILIEKFLSCCPFMFFLIYMRMIFFLFIIIIFFNTCIFNNQKNVAVLEEQ